MGARRQDGSLQRRKRAGKWKWLALWWEDGHRKAKTLGVCNTMTKAEAEEELAAISHTADGGRRKGYLLG